MHPVRTLPRHIRFIHSVSELSELELMAESKFDDAVFITNAGHLGVMRQIPYRIMLPQKIENLIVSGKCVTGSIAVRAIPMIMAMGQGAGIAAAVAVKDNVSPKSVDNTKLRAELLRQNVILALPE